MSARPFDRPYLMALDPRAFGVMVSEVKAPTRTVERVGTAAVVSIVGPLEHHAGEGFCDSYEAILARVAEACESDAECVVLKVDSPGGLVSGCFGTANAIRAKCDAVGKPLLGFVSGSASSAAYALISQAKRIVLGVGSTVGSVGIIDARVDATKQAAAMGLRFAFITSGECKADGNPHMPISEEELARRQDAVDTLASVFFDLVAQHRPTTAEKIKALEARSFTGQAAIENGLADAVGTFEELLAFAAGDQQTEQTMDMRKALEEAAKGDGEEAKKAQRALAAWDEKEEAKAEESEEDDKEEAKAEDDGVEEKKDDQEKKEEAKAAVPSASNLSTLKAIEDEQRRAFLDTRPDLTAAQVASVQGLPMVNVRAIVNAIPKGAKPKHAATAAATGTRAEGQRDQPFQGLISVTAEEREMDARMGMTTYDMGVRREGTAMVFGVMPVQKAAPAAGKDGAK